MVRDDPKPPDDSGEYPKPNGWLAVRFPAICNSTTGGPARE